MDTVRAGKVRMQHGCLLAECESLDDGSGGSSDEFRGRWAGCVPSVDVRRGGGRWICFLLGLQMQSSDIGVDEFKRKRAWRQQPPPLKMVERRLQNSHITRHV